MKCHAQGRVSLHLGDSPLHKSLLLAGGHTIKIERVLDIGNQLDALTLIESRHRGLKVRAHHAESLTLDHPERGSTNEVSADGRGSHLEHGQGRNFPTSPAASPRGRPSTYFSLQSIPEKQVPILPTHTSPTIAAERIQQAARELAHRTRTIDNPREIYPILESLSSATAALGQCLQQLAAIHDDASLHPGWTVEDSRINRAATYRASWELHRAAEVICHVTTALDVAHESEATLRYHRDVVAADLTSSQSVDRGLGL